MRRRNLILETNRLNFQHGWKCITDEWTRKLNFVLIFYLVLRPASGMYRAVEANETDNPQTILSSIRDGSELCRIKFLLGDLGRRSHSVLFGLG